MPENLNDWMGLILPEQTINYVTNPSFEVDTSGWTPGSVTTDIQPVAARFGGFGCKITPSAGGNSFRGGTYDATNDPSASDWTASAYMWASQQVDFHFEYGVGAPQVVSHPGDSKWRRLVNTRLALPNGPGATLALNFKHPASSGWQPYYIDAIQLEKKAYATSYCDGDQDECVWSGRRHRSRSTRQPNANSGGVYKSFRELGINVRSILGAGAPPIENISDPYAILPGSEYQGTTINARVMTLNCQAIAHSRTALHALRQLLIQSMVIIGKSRTPIWLWYRHPTGEITRIGVHYDGGLELGESTNYMEPFPIRLIAHDPYWQSDHDLAVGITGQNLISGNGIAIRRENPTSDTPSDWGWAWMGYQSGDNVSQIRVIETAPDGTVYVAGTFTTIGGVAANNIAYFDGERWNAMGTGVAADTVRAITFGDDGTVYIGGSFTTIGGVAAQRFAKWDGTNFGVTLNYTSGTVMALVKRPSDGRIFVGGNMVRGAFSCLDGYDPAFGSGNFDDAAVNAISFTASTSPVVNALAFHNGELYFGGNFTGISTSVSGVPTVVPMNNVGKYVFLVLPSNHGNAFALGSGFASTSNVVYDLVESADGRYVYATGQLTQTFACPMAAWDGSAWSTPGMAILQGWTPFSTRGVKLRNDPDGNVWMIMESTSISASLSDHMIVASGPTYTVASAGNTFRWIQNVVRWNGVEWTGIDAMFYGGNTITTGDHQEQYAIAFNNAGEMMIGSRKQSTGLVRPGSFTGISKPITVDAPTPIQVAIGYSNYIAAYLARITNWSSGRELFFQNLNIPYLGAPNNGGSINIDTRIGRQQVRIAAAKDGIEYLTGDSNLAKFWLQAGKNKLTLSTVTYTPSTSFLPDASGAPGSIYFRERLLSIDAIPRETV